MTAYLPALLAIVCSSACDTPKREESRQTAFPKSVLITNDDGIADPDLHALARAFAKVSRTVVVAPRENKSGSSQYLSVLSSRQLTVEPETIDDGIEAYAVRGFPADCVLWALTNLLINDPPDLVLSGINGGPNLGGDWFLSGTIGAARTAAYLGVPSLAVSGVDADVPGSVDRLSKWVVELSQSAWVREMKPGRYLTVSVPLIPPDRIKGVKVTTRSGLLPVSRWSPIGPEDGTLSRTWRLKLVPSKSPPPGTDVAAFQDGYIAIVPMTLGGRDDHSFQELQRRAAELPAWR